MSSKPNDLVSNRRATFNYEILDTLEAGIMLQGTEIKSLRNNGGTLQDAFVKVIDSEPWLVGCHIAPYTFGNVYNHSERRERKLLLHKREIARIEEAVSLKGLAVIPLALYLKNGRVKVRLAIARGKKSHDKRHAVQERDEKKQISRMMKKHL